MSAGGAPPPRWPHGLWISPTALNNYRNCPFRVRLKYIDKVPEPFTYNVFLAKGRIAHLALKRIAEALSRGQEPIGPDEVLRMALLQLPRQEFPSEEIRMAEAREIVRWVDAGRHYIENIPAPNWVLIERNLHRDWYVQTGKPYTLMARPDAIVRRSDSDGNPLFEIIDYKTGKPRPDNLAPVVIRFVARDLLRHAVGNASLATVRFTWLWLGAHEQESRDLSVEFCNEHWRVIEEEVHHLVTESEWATRPSPGCRFCPFHNHVCQEKIPHDAWS